MKLRRAALLIGLYFGAIAHGSTANAESPAPRMPEARPPLIFSGKFESLARVRRGGIFSLKVKLVNGLVYSLPKLTVTVAGKGVKVSSAGTKVFKNVEGNGGTVTLVIKGKLRDAHGMVHLVATTSVVDEDIGPFELKQDLSIGAAP